MKKINKSKIFDLINSRFNKKFEEFGDDPKSVGWDNKRNQNLRFANATRLIDFKNNSIVDIGCGLGDFYNFLISKNIIKKEKFTGLDLNSNFIKLCKHKYPDANFKISNFLLDENIIEKADIFTMFGLLNINFKEIDNYDYSRIMIKKGFLLCKKFFIFDMLSFYNDTLYEKEDFVFYYKPEKILEFCLKLTPHVSLIHDYASIPQREFMIILRKDPWK